MFKEFIKAFALIFVAEMGDKTQVLLMTCAARYSLMQMLLGIMIGVAFNHGLAILIGNYIANIVDTDLLQVFAGVIFIIFGILAFADDRDENGNAKTLKCGPILTIALTFFLGELGDKTQLTAMTIAMEAKYPFIILLGSITGMIAIGCFGIIIGTALTKQIPSYIIKIVSGLIFIVFGISKLFTVFNIFVNNIYNQSILITVVGFISLLSISKLISNR